jgi:hypothetical protein
MFFHIQLDKNIVMEARHFGKNLRELLLEKLKTDVSAPSVIPSVTSHRPNTKCTLSNPRVPTGKRANQMRRERRGEQAPHGRGAPQNPRPQLRVVHRFPRLPAALGASSLRFVPHKLSIQSIFLIQTFFPNQTGGGELQRAAGPYDCALLQLYSCCFDPETTEPSLENAGSRGEKGTSGQARMEDAANAHGYAGTPSSRANSQLT